MENLEALIEALQKAERILIASHVNPDGDSIGTLIGLGLALESLGKEVIMVNSDETPLMFKFLKGANRIHCPKEIESIPETVVLVDCTDLERVGTELAERLKEATVLINIDHHVSNNYFGHYNLVDANAAATAEIILRLLPLLEIEPDKDIATALYTGLVMDTGSFQYSNTTPAAHRSAAYLLEKDVDLDQVRNVLFETRTVSMLRLIGEALRLLQLTPDGKIAWVEITQEIMHQTGARDEHCEGIINYPRSVMGVEIAILFREITPGKIKVGLRSKRKVNVNQLAGFFGGGGHQRAAGCIIEGNMKEVVPKVLEEAQKLLA